MVEQVVNRLIAALQNRYPFITMKVVYEPPDGVDAWVVLHGTTDADQWDEIRQFGHSVTDPASENEGVWVLIH